MKDRDYKDLVIEYLSDDDTNVKIEMIGNKKLVLDIGKSDGHLRHFYEGKTFKEIFYRYFADSIIENIDIYKYLLDEFPELAGELLVTRKDMYEYISYIVEWYEDHEFGCPACYNEWRDNEMLMQ